MLAWVKKRHQKREEDINVTIDSLLELVMKDCNTNEVAPMFYKGFDYSSLNAKSKIKLL